MHTQFEEIRQELMDDERNVAFTSRGIPPIFQASAKARILIIGQAPGARVEQTGIPFNDKSGEKLMGWMGIDREIFYSDLIAIVPMDFYFPGKGKTGDLPPRKFIAQEYHQRILQTMPHVQTTMLIGSYAMKHYLGSRMEKNLTETVRNYRKYVPEYFPLVHPSPLNFRWQKGNPWFEELVVPQLKALVSECLAGK